VAADPNAIHLGVGTTVEEAERQLILKTLASTSNNKTRAAEILQISLKTLHNKLKEYGAATAEVAGEKKSRPSREQRARREKFDRVAASRVGGFIASLRMTGSTIRI